VIAELERLDKNGGSREARHLLITAHILLGDVLTLRAAEDEAHKQYELANSIGDAW